LARLSDWSDRQFKWLLVAPAVLLILALSVYPLLFSVWVAFVNYDFQIPGHAFIGLKNFSQVVFDPVARWSLVLTVLLSAANVAIEFGLGLALALAMVRSFPGRGLIMSILIVPLFISPVIVGQAWALLLQRPFGPTNYLLGQILGREVTIGWLTESPWLYIALILADVWQWTPFVMIVLVAGLRSLPEYVYEAAALDGLGPVETFFKVTLPLLRPVILIVLLLRFMDAFKLMDLVFMMTKGGPAGRTETLSYYIYVMGLQLFRVGLAAAVSILFLILINIVTQIFVRYMYREQGRAELA
jgi:multiple sugar transport system permease protein